MEIQLFGGVRAVGADGVALDVGPAKCQVVLAALALAPGSAVPVWRLVDTVWGEDPPRTAARTLQSYVARLRRGLGPEAIIRSGGAYRLNVAPDAVDVARFERLLDAGSVAAALQEWAGIPLAGLEAPGLDTAVTGLTERWLGAIELDLEHRVASDPAAVIGRLTELTAAHPYREGLWALLMTALYRVGRQADALAAYRSARGRLIEELGVEPGPRLQELELQILRHDDQLTERTESAGSPVPARPAGTVTFAFTDIEGASHWWSVDREAMPAAMARYYELVQLAAEHGGGYIFSKGGDSFGVAFSRADRARDWALGLQGAIEDEPWPNDLALRIRIGLHTGEAEEYEGGYFGPAVNVAVRLAAAGHGGQTLLSGAVAGLLENTALRDLGWYRLDDVVAEQHLFQLGDVECPPLRLEDRFRGNLPRGLGTPIGRNSELEAVAAALAAYPVVTLVGPGGIGKTTVALAAAGRIETAGDSWLIELAEVDTVQHVVRAIADTLGVKERHGATLTRSIVETLQSRQALLILDNCEHVVDAAADFATAATRGCEGVRVLATSRERLGLTSERIINIPPLDPAGTAVELFAERAVAVASGFDAAAERSVVEEICRRLDGVPLAIELAAAHMASLTADELASLLGRHLQILDGTRRGGLDRHRTLRAAIQWSHDLLAPVERALFARLSIFTGSFDLDAVEWVGAFEAADAVQVAGALSRLVEQSMVHVESGPFGRRFRLLEPIRQYGRECLAGVGEAAAVAARHAKWCHCEVTGVYNLISGWGEIEGVARLAELWPNLRAAFDWACGAGDLDLARDLMRPILSEVVVRSNNEIGDWAEQLLELTPIEDEAGLVFGLYAAAHRYSMSQDPAAYEALVARYREPDHVLMHHARAIAYEDYEMMAEWAPRAAEEFRRQGDDLLAERGDLYLAGALMNLGRFEEGDAILEQLLARYRDQGPPTFINWTLLLLGYSAVFQGRREDADAYFDEGVAVEVPPRTHTPSRPLEARAAFRRGNHLRAYRILQAHLDELLVTDNMQAGVIDCIEFVNMMAEVGRTEEAAKVLAHLEATGIFEAPGWWSLVATAAEVIAGSEGVGDPEDHDALDDDRAALEYVRAVIGEVADD